MNDLPGRGDVNPYGIPMPNPHEREGPDEEETMGSPREDAWMRQTKALTDRALKAEADADRLREALREAIADHETGRCPRCGQPGPAADELVEALEGIERLQAKWQAPIRSHDWAESNRRWAPAGSEAHKIAVNALARYREASGGE